MSLPLLPPFPFPLAPLWPPSFPRPRDLDLDHFLCPPRCSLSASASWSLPCCRGGERCLDRSLICIAACFSLWARFCLSLFSSLRRCALSFFDYPSCCFCRGAVYGSRLRSLGLSRGVLAAVAATAASTLAVTLNTWSSVFAFIAAVVFLFLCHHLDHRLFQPRPSVETVVEEVPGRLFKQQECVPTR